jgi:hypothetical protein
VYPLNTVLVGEYPLNTVLIGEYQLNTVLVGAYPLYTVNTPYSLNTYLEGPAFNYRSHETKIVLFAFMPNGYWPSSSGLRGQRSTYLTILESAWSANFKMV